MARASLSTRWANGVSVWPCLWGGLAAGRTPLGRSRPCSRHCSARTDDPGGPGRRCRRRRDAHCLTPWKKSEPLVPTLPWFPRSAWEPALATLCVAPASSGRLPAQWTQSVHRAVPTQSVGTRVGSPLFPRSAWTVRWRPLRRARSQDACPAQWTQSVHQRGSHAERGNQGDPTWFPRSAWEPRGGRSASTARAGVLNLRARTQSVAKAGSHAERGNQGSVGPGVPTFSRE